MTDNKKIRVLVVDDSFFMKRLIKNILEESREIEIIGQASNSSDKDKSLKS